jgi:hypothetical protein
MDVPVTPSPPPAGTHRAPFPVIVGCPRSGTSLLAVMLDAHPDLAFPNETAFFKHVVALRGSSAFLRDKFTKIVTLDRAPHSNWSDFGLDKDAFVARMQGIEPFTVAAGLRDFFDQYAARHGKRRAGEKTPDNTAVMGEIAAILPETHFVHVIRDPRDTVLSWQKAWFAPTRDVGMLAAAWQKIVTMARHSGATAARYVEVRYEDLVLKPEETLRKLCAFLALDFVPAMVDASAQGAARIARLNERLHVNGRLISREQRTAIHVNLARPPLPERVGVWRRELSAEDRVTIERAADPLFHTLGYATEIA